jgi:hypothetical protein
MKALDFILELEFSAFEFDDLFAIGGRAGEIRLDLTFYSLMTAFQLDEMTFKRHRITSTSITDVTSLA